MIKLISELFEKEVELDTSKFYSIIIENKAFNYEICKYLYNDFCSNVEYFKIFKDDKKLDISNESIFIYNLFSLDLNTKRNINALYKLLKKSCSDSLQSDIKNIKNSILEVVKRISLDFDIELDVNNDIKEDDFFKIVDLRFGDEDFSYLLKLKKYIDTAYELMGVKVFFINHIHDYFENNEINTLIRELSYKQISIFNIEQSNLIGKAENEEFIIVDHDLCSIE